MADYIITNGQIVNGKNEPSFPGNVVIEDGMIREITKPGELPEDFPREKILDAGGLEMRRRRASEPAGDHLCGQRELRTFGGAGGEGTQ